MHLKYSCVPHITSYLYYLNTWISWITCIVGITCDFSISCTTRLASITFVTSDVFLDIRILIDPFWNQKILKHYNCYAAFWKYHFGAFQKYHCYAAFRKYNFATYQKYHFYAAFRKYNFAAFQKAKLPFLSSLSGLTSSQVDDQSVGVEGNSTGGTVTPCLKKMFCFTTFVLVIIP